MLFLILAFIPGIKQHPDKVNLIFSVSKKFRKAGIISLIILLITGIMQLNYRGVQWSMSYFTGSTFGKTAALKMLTFVGIILINLIHDFYLGNRAIEAWKNDPESKQTIKLRNRSRLLGRLSFLLALLAVFLGIVLTRGC